MMHDDNAPTRQPSWLLAILATILFLPIGVFALLTTARARAAARAGQTATATAQSRAARTLGITGLVGGAVFVLVAALAVVAVPPMLEKVMIEAGAPSSTAEPSEPSNDDEATDFTDDDVSAGNTLADLERLQEGASGPVTFVHKAQLAPGDCVIRGENTFTLPEFHTNPGYFGLDEKYFLRVDCDTPHSDEVYRVVQDEAETFDDRLTLWDVCPKSELRDYLGDPDAESREYDTSDVSPNSTMWEAGDRTIVCFFAQESSRYITGHPTPER